MKNPHLQQASRMYLANQRIVLKNVPDTGNGGKSLYMFNKKSVSNRLKLFEPREFAVYNYSQVAYTIHKPDRLTFYSQLFWF